MNKIKLILLASLIAGCSTEGGSLNKEAVKNKIRTSTIIVDPPSVSMALSKRTKAQALAKFAVATVVSSVASSGNVNAKNPADFQKVANQNLEFGRALNDTLTTSLPDTYKIDNGAGVELDIARKMSEKLTRQGANTLHLKISPALWELEYVSFLTSSNYALKYQFNAFILETVGDKEVVVDKTTCVGQAEKEMPLEAWEKDEHSAVNEEAEKISNKCTDMFMTYFG